MMLHADWMFLYRNIFVENSTSLCNKWAAELHL